MNKWGREYWIDLGERVGATFIGALLTVFTVTGATPLDWTDSAAVWAILGVPTLVSFLKGILVNLGGAEPTASVANVTSTGSRVLR